MNKVTLITKIIARLSESLDTLDKAARAAHAEATHESSKAENKYDTRGLEAAYLAGGQARQVREIQDSIKVFSSLRTKDFVSNAPVDLTALVQLETEGMSSWYFIGPRNGGLEVDYNGKEITVITPQSPLGQTLMGKTAGARWTTKLGGATVKYHVASVM